MMRNLIFAVIAAMVAATPAAAQNSFPRTLPPLILVPPPRPAPPPPPPATRPEAGLYRIQEQYGACLEPAWTNVNPYRVEGRECPRATPVQITAFDETRFTVEYPGSDLCFQWMPHPQSSLVRMLRAGNCNGGANQQIEFQRLPNSRWLIAFEGGWCLTSRGRLPDETIFVIGTRLDPCAPADSSQHFRLPPAN